MTVNGYAPFDKAAKEAMVERFTTQWQPMRDLTPGGGAYLNEVNTGLVFARNFTVTDGY